MNRNNLEKQYSKMVKQEVIALLQSFGYIPDVRETSMCVDIFFHVSHGSDSMPIRHKDAISMLAKGYLNEFYYANDTQHVYLLRERKGLCPDDDRYSCLIHEVRLVRDEKCSKEDIEIFVNKQDHFERLVNGKDVTSKD